MRTTLEWNLGNALALAVQEQAQPSRIITTPGELITALQDVVGQDDALVMATVLRLLQSGRLALPGTARTRGRIQQ